MPNKYEPPDHTVNCDQNNPLTGVNRGRVKVSVLYDNPVNPRSELFVELRIGMRRQRTPISAGHDHATILSDVLSLLGFEPTMVVGAINYDDDYGEA